MSGARWILLAVVAAAIGGAWLAVSSHLLGWESLAAWHGWIQAHRVAGALIYCALYAALVGASVPAGGLISVAGGSLFGVAAGSVLAVTGASLGAILLFVLARGTLGRLLAVRAAPLLERVGPMLERDGFWGLLSLRLIPVVPFWLGNLAPALLGMRLLPFAVSTVLGIIPATTVLVSLGAGLGATVTAGRAPDVASLLSPGILLPIFGLALLSLLPIALRRRPKGADGAA